MPIFIKQGNTYVEHQIIVPVANTPAPNSDYLISVLQSDPNKKAEDIINDK